MIGQTIAHYRITATIGAGGMGEVYRAHDPKLNRDVAIKVLPPALADDADYLARFQREAQALAALNHPNIAQIYGIEENAIVMELVDGDTLQTPLPLDEALSVAKQIAEALEAAHDKGIIHRDLKPGNIKITPGGTVKVLDFGLAKTVDSSRAAASGSSPTITLRATQAGIILGTAAYMSPEQARGKAVDKRADIWAFGVVLFEMLAGQQMFSGETTTDILAAVVTKEPDWSTLPPSIPAWLRALLQRCLQKDPRRRLRDIGDARLILEEPPVAETTHVTRSAKPWSWIAACLLLAGVAAAAWLYRPKSETPYTRFTADLGNGLVVRDAAGGPTSAVGPAVVISPDGRRMVFVASQAGRPARLFMRRLDEPTAAALDGTDEAVLPFFSPDGQWIGFFSGGKLRKLRVDGGAPIPLADAPLPMGGAWDENGAIIASLSLTTPLLRITERGIGSEPVTKLIPETENSHRWPQVLPGGKAVLFSAGRGGEFQHGEIAAVRLDNGQRKTIHKGATFGRYLASGHITFIERSSLFAAPFDVKRLEITGPAVPVLNDVRFAPDAGGAQFDVSRTGIALYRAGASDAADRSVELVDQQGKTSPLLNRRGPFQYPTLSPDGSRLAIQIAEGSNEQIWVFDLRRQTATRLSFAEGSNFRPRWSPDGRRVIYSTSAGIVWTRADGSGSPVKLVDAPGGIPTAGGMTPDGKRLVFFRGVGPTSSCWSVTVDGDPEQPRTGTPEPCLNTKEQSSQVEISPDGRWISYVSAVAGRSELFVRSFPDRGGKWQVSNGGGTRSAWSPNGCELFFQSGTDEIMVAACAVSGSSIAFAPARVWSKTKLFLTNAYSRHYSIAPDGKHLAILVESESDRQPEPHVMVLFNFFDEVKRRIAGGAR